MRRAPSARWLLLALASVATACATVFTALAPRRDRITFPHQRHAEAKVDCLSCHEEIFEATDFSASNLPREKKCLECHKEEKEKGNCGFCHSGEPETYAPKERHLVMSHEKHLERVEDEDCRVCHEVLPEPGFVGSVAPPMRTCLGCHEHQEHFAQGDCSRCHEGLTRFPLRPVTAFSHRGDFLRDHRHEARTGAAVCAQCHEQSFCTDCHGATVSTRVELKYPERVDRAFIHRADFLGRHSIEARAEGPMCQGCHGTSFCQECHTSRGLTPEGTRAMNPHPPGFATRGGADFHGDAARRDIASCAACHDQGAQSNCVDCHRVGGIGGNPHPQSWTLRHGREEISRNAMCRSCHF